MHQVYSNKNNKWKTTKGHLNNKLPDMKKCREEETMPPWRAGQKQPTTPPPDTRVRPHNPNTPTETSTGQVAPSTHIRSKGLHNSYPWTISRTRASPDPEEARQTESLPKKWSIREFQTAHTTASQINKSPKVTILLDPIPTKLPKILECDTNSRPNHLEISYQTGKITSQVQNKWSVDSSVRHKTHK